MSLHVKLTIKHLNMVSHNSIFTNLLRTDNGPKSVIQLARLIQKDKNENKKKIQKKYLMHSNSSKKFSI